MPAVELVRTFIEYHISIHRSTVLQKLHECGAPTFDQDFIIFWHRRLLDVR